MGRWLNADEFLDQRELQGMNLFAYCGNNPVIRADSNGQFWFVIIGIVVFGACLISMSGCSKQNNVKINYGSARAYNNIKGGQNTPNCYAYAIGLSNALNPGNMSKQLQKFNDVNADANAVIADLKAMGRSGRIIDGVNGAINSNEYRIALRCGTKTYDGSHYDYHFMVQNSDGRWSEKHGTGGSSIRHNAGENPNNLSWDLGNIKGYYDSKIIFIAVTR